MRNLLSNDWSDHLIDYQNNMGYWCSPWLPLKGRGLAPTAKTLPRKFKACFLLYAMPLLLVDHWGILLSARNSVAQFENNHSRRSWNLMEILNPCDSSHEQSLLVSWIIILGAFHPLFYILNTEWFVPVHMCAQCASIFQRPNQVCNFLASGIAWFSRNINTNTPKSNAVLGVYGGKKKKIPLLALLWTTL